MFTINTLYANGWTIRQAAAKLGLSYSHVSYVLRGERESAKVIRSLQALPKRELQIHRGRKPRTSPQLVTK